MGRTLHTSLTVKLMMNDNSCFDLGCDINIIMSDIRGLVIVHPPLLTRDKTLGNKEKAYIQKQS
jgi:hypothetical protein